jgi:hypothetical protein
MTARPRAGHTSNVALPADRARPAPALPQHDPERNLIGYVLVHGRRAFALLDRGYLTPADFKFARNRIVWGAIERLYMCGAEIDTEATARELGYERDGFPDVRSLLDYLRAVSEPKSLSYVLHPFDWPMTDDDFLDAAGIVAKETVDAGE